MAIKSPLRLLTSFVVLGWASTAWTQVPIESYIFNAPGGQATNLTGLRIPAATSSNASSLVWVSPSSLGGGSSITYGTGVQTALGNPLNTTGGLVGFSGSVGTPTQLNLTNATGLPLAGVATGLSGTQCIHSVSGVLAGTGSDCGSGGGGGLSGMALIWSSRGLSQMATSIAVRGLSQPSLDGFL